MASPLGLARDEPAENPEDSRLQGRGLLERPDTRTARQLAETPRAAWDRISRMLDASEKDALLEEFHGILQLCEDGVSLSFDLMLKVLGEG